MRADQVEAAGVGDRDGLHVLRMAELLTAHRIEHMHDPTPSRLDLLRFLERVQEQDLARTRRWIADEERRESERRTGAENRPAPPDWLLDYGLNKDAMPTGVHVGGCHMVGQRAKGTDGDTARRALAAGVPGCGHCRPDTALGVLD